VKIVVIGYGSIGRRHIGNIANLEIEAEVYCFRRSNCSIDEFPYVRVLTDVEQVKALNPDVILVCNPSHLHLDWIELAVELNSHVFVEKPMATSRSDLNRAISLVDSFHDKVFFIGFMMRYHKGIVALNEKLSSGEIGSLYHARLEFGGYLPSWPYVDYKQSYAARKDMGGGVIFTISHELDTAQYLFGYDAALTVVKSSTNLLDITGEEMAELVLNYPDKQVSIHLDYLQRDYHRTIRVLGDRGSLMWDWNSGTVTLKRVGEKPEIVFEAIDFDVNQLYLDELCDFFSLIENNRYNHALNIEHAIKNTELLLKSI
jgi:predicted dehydrogenase